MDSYNYRDSRIINVLLSLIWREAGFGLRVRFVVIILLVLAIASINTAIPVLFQKIIDRFVSSPAAIPVLLIGLYIACQGLVRICGELRWFFYGQVEQNMQRNLSLRLFDHVHGLSLQFHIGRRTGALQQVVGNGLLGYCLILQNALYVVIPLAFELALMCGVIVMLGRPVFLIVILVTALLYLGATIAGTERQRVMQREAATAQTEAAAKSLDSYLNYETIKYFSGENVIRERLNGTLKQSEDGWVRYYKRRSATGLAQAACLTLGLGAVTALAAQSLSAGAMTVGGFVLVIMYLLQILRPLETFGFAYREIKTGITYVEQLLGLLDERSMTDDNPMAGLLPPGRGKIVFSNIRFAYEAGRPVLENVTFSVPPGRTVAVVGPSGAGKSTLSRLLFRFYKADEGSIEIDGCNVNDIALTSLREAIAVVPQDMMMFNDTIGFNIAIARPDCRFGEIEESARLAGIHDFIATLPDGYDTLVGEGGLKLSRGERQRIAIARAILKQPRIFVFDEATSSLDVKTERLIQRNIRELSLGTTTLLIAHRLSTVVHADEILVLNNGRIAERGSHDELIALGGVYSAMWLRQQDVRKNI